MSFIKISGRVGQWVKALDRNLKVTLVQTPLGARLDSGTQSLYEVLADLPVENGQRSYEQRMRQTASSQVSQN